ncbi:MAG: hypothetical protein EBZ59_07160 [Planctomycetia bacterium]|nr:hypothetical protein [Planctomycetia bacterium]
MRPCRNESSQTTAVLTLAEIKAAVEAFDRGDANVFDTLDAIIVAFEARRAVVRPEALRDAA